MKNEPLFETVMRAVRTERRERRKKFDDEVSEIFKDYLLLAGMFFFGYGAGTERFLIFLIGLIFFVFGFFASLMIKNKRKRNAKKS
jgi:hypothetical protein